MSKVHVFSKWGVKTVTKTDISKKAYVPNSRQVEALREAKIKPKQGVEFAVGILFDTELSSLKASYYHSAREGSGRNPEPRMGRDFVTVWLKQGDEVVLGNIGNRILAYKVTPSAPVPDSHGRVALSAKGPATVGTGTLQGAGATSTGPASAVTSSGGIKLSSAAMVPASTPASGSLTAQVITSSTRSVEDDAEKIRATENPKEIFRKALQASGAPAKRIVQRQDFDRNPHVVAAAIIRASGACEMPGCTLPPIEKADGTRYLEVHHITTLSNGGDDTLENVAALCPHCHRTLHYSRDRDAMAVKLRRHILAISKKK